MSKAKWYSLGWIIVAGCAFGSVFGPVIGLGVVAILQVLAPYNMG